MSDKPTLSVEHLKAWAELHGLLDKPVESVIDLDALDWESVKQAASESKWMPPEYMRNEWVADVCEFLRADRAAKHQGEPVAVVVSSSWDSKRGSSCDIQAIPPITLECGTKLYAEQPAPVAVVMPPELDVRDGYSLSAVDWYNLALSDVAKLNEVKP